MPGIVRTLQRSFAGGEITPELFGRIDLSKFQSGLDTCKNFIVLPHGPAVNRPGLGYILRSKYSNKQSRLIPFAYSSEQTYALEFGDQYLRFHLNGGTLLETGKTLTAITQASPGVLTSAAHGFSNGEWVYLSAIGGMTQLNGRFFIVANKTTNTFELTDLFGNAVSTAAYSAYTSGGTAARVYEISTPYVEADLFDLHYCQSADVMTIVHPSYAIRELRRSAAVSWALTSLTLNADISAPTGLSTSGSGTGGTTYTYVVTAVASSNLEESVASSETSRNNDLTVAGTYNDITWNAVTGAVRYNVYQKINGLYGYIGQAAGTTFRDDYITPDATRTPPETVSLFASSNNYPSAVCYFEQRRCFAGSNNSPQNLWLSRSGTESNFMRSIPTNNDDSISVRMVAMQANRIQHIIPLADLIILTASGEWRAWADGGGAITPSSLAVRPQAYFGAGDITPAVTGGSILYVQAQSAHIRELSYGTDAGGFKQLQSVDVSIMAPHLFDGYSIVDMAYMRSPLQTLWAVRSDGVLLGMTYVPEQEVIAWHRHETDGLFESICVIAEAGEDILYAVVKRTINGETVRYVERLHSRQFTDLEDAFFVDSGITYSGAAADTLSGLDHLEGEDVVVLGDGAVFAAVTVSGGAITLPVEVSTAHVGLAYESLLKTLPFAANVEASGLQGHFKAINKAFVRCYKSSGIFAGPDEDHLSEYKQRGTEPYGSPPGMVNDMVGLALPAAWSQSGQIVVKHTDPTPIDVLSMVLEASIGG